jgi:NADH-quinone oxidoreductase subunit N
MWLLLPEFIVIATAFTLLLVDLWIGHRRGQWLAPIALIGFAAAFVALMATPMAGEAFGGRFTIDSVTWWFKLIFLVSAFFTVALSLDLMDRRCSVPATGLANRGEYYTILALTVAGMLFLVSARDIVLLYVGLELATIPLFALAAWQRVQRSGEAGLKYVVLGALASALLLYGLGIIYGLTGSTSLDAVRQALEASPAFWFAVATIMAGVGFKMTLFPFHMWAADVYEGAPTPVTAYLSVASKAAGLGLMFQLFFRTFGGFIAEWGMLIAILAALTMTLGNLVAVLQENIKRFMAFSAVSQAGYLLLGFLGATSQGVSAMLFYLLVYVAANLVVFGVIIFYANETGRERIDEYKGLSQTNPVMALAMMLALFSLAGIPPLAGFVGKFFLFSVASQAGYHWLVAIAALNSTVSLYYYLRIIRQMYIEAPAVDAQPLRVTFTLGATVGVMAVATVLAGLIPVVYETIYATTRGWLVTLGI